VEATQPPFGMMLSCNMPARTREINVYAIRRGYRLGEFYVASEA